MKNYELKKEKLYIQQNGKCPVCQKELLIGTTDLHHKMRNTKGNRKRYPLLIDSIYNLELIHHNCHISKHSSCGMMWDIEAEKLEKILKENLEKNK